MAAVFSLLCSFISTVKSAVSVCSFQQGKGRKPMQWQFWQPATAKDDSGEMEFEQKVAYRKEGKELGNRQSAPAVGIPIPLLLPFLRRREGES